MENPELELAKEKVTKKLMEDLAPGTEIDLTDKYCLYHYIEEKIYVINETETWTEILQVMYEDDDKLSFEVL